MTDRRLVHPFWFPAVSVQARLTGIAHRRFIDGGPACGAQVFLYAGWTKTPGKSRLQPCKRCLRVVQAAQKKRLVAALRAATDKQVTAMVKLIPKPVRPPGYYI